MSPHSSAVTHVTFAHSRFLFPSEATSVTIETQSIFPEPTFWAYVTMAVVVVIGTGHFAFVGRLPLPDQLYSYWPMDIAIPLFFSLNWCSALESLSHPLSFSSPPLCLYRPD